jgi:hypothetical protein
VTNNNNNRNIYIYIYIYISKKSISKKAYQGVAGPKPTLGLFTTGPNGGTGAL